MARNKNFNPIGSYPVYDQEYDRLRMQSKVLNNNSNVGFGQQFWDKSNIISALSNLQGNASGFTIRDGKKIPCKIGLIKDEIRELEFQFSDYCHKQTMQGKSKPSIWPEKLETQRLKAEATLSVYEEEVVQLTKWLDNFAGMSQLANDNFVLKHGAVGASRLREGKIVEIDGMTVSFNSEGIAYIGDTRSPYNGYSVADYTLHIVNVWKTECSAKAKFNTEKAREQNSTLSQSQKVGRNCPLPSMPEYVSKASVSSFIKE